MRDWGRALGTAGVVLATLAAAGLTAACVAVRRRQAKDREDLRTLQVANQRLRGIIDGTPDLIAVLDREFRFTDFNRAYADEFLKLSGRPVALGKNLLDYLAPHPKARAQAEAQWERALRGEEFTVIEQFGRDRAYVRLYEITYNAIRDDDHAIIGASHIARDITDRLHLERQRQEGRALLTAVIDKSTAVIYVKDAEGRYELVNHLFEQLFGRSRAEIIGKTDFDLFDAKTAEYFRANDRRVLEAGSALEFEEEVPQDDGPHMYISLKFPLSPLDGRPSSLCGISTDITQRKQAEERLRRQNARLHEAAKLSLLAILIASAAHEIKNPLGWIINDVSVLRRDLSFLLELIELYRGADQALARHDPALFDQIRARVDEFDLPYTRTSIGLLLERLDGGLKRIKELSHDLGNSARPEEGTLNQVDLNDVARSSVNIITGYAKKRQVQLASEPGPLPLVQCVPGKVGQIMLNLLSNAIDASPPGSTVTLRTEATADGVALHVIDRGHGIDPALLDRVFEPYVTTKPVHEGTGLGLALSRDIARAHGGAITVVSDPGRETRFTVHLPLSPPHPGGP